MLLSLSLSFVNTTAEAQQDKPLQVAALEEERQSKEAKLEKMEALESQVATLNEQLQQLQRPWWQKLFGPPEPVESK